MREGTRMGGAVLREGTKIGFQRQGGRMMFGASALGGAGASCLSGAASSLNSSVLHSS